MAHLHGLSQAERAREELDGTGTSTSATVFWYFLWKLLSMNFQCFNSVLNPRIVDGHVSWKAFNHNCVRLVCCDRHSHASQVPMQPMGLVGVRCEPTGFYVYMSKPTTPSSAHAHFFASVYIFALALRAIAVQRCVESCFGTAWRALDVAFMKDL